MAAARGVGVDTCLSPAVVVGDPLLGLAIVHSIAAAHGASLGARANREGGLEVTVTFARPPAA